jgi:hypothetical protein
VDGCPDAAVPLAASLAVHGSSQEQRVAAIRALGAAPSRAGLEALVAIVTPKKKTLWRRKPSRTPEYRAAVTALRARSYEPAVREILDRLGER